MTSIGVIKGQPFRFGTFDPNADSNRSTTIHFISDSAVEQSKAAPAISQVKAKDTFLSAHLALCKILFGICSDPLEDSHAAGLWTGLSATSNTIVFVNRQYVMSQIQRILPGELDDARKKLECRRLLCDLESAWNTSILKPKLIPALFCSHGWNAKTQTLYTMPYRSLPIGRLESIGSPALARTEPENVRDGDRGLLDKLSSEGTTGLIHKSEPYAKGSFNVDLSASESSLNDSSTEAKIYLVYIDSLGTLKPDVNWPNLLAENVSNELSRFMKTADVIVVDSASKVNLYQKALGRHLKADNKRFDHVLPCCSFRQQGLLAEIWVDALISSDQKKSRNSSLDQLNNVDDLGALTRAFHDLYPGYTPEEGLPSSIVARAIRQFGYSLDDYSGPFVLSGRAEVPADSQSPSALYLIYSQIRVLLELLIKETSHHLLIRRSDLSDEQYTKVREGNNGTFARLVRVSSQDKSALSVGLDLEMALAITRSLCMSELENPYKLVKLLDMNRVQEIANEEPSKLSIILLEDY